MVGAKGWVLLTADKRIRYNFLEKRALEQHAVREFVFASGNMSVEDMGAALELALPKMRRLARKLKIAVCRRHHSQRRGSSPLAQELTMRCVKRHLRAILELKTTDESWESANADRPA